MTSPTGKLLHQATPLPDNFTLSHLIMGEPAGYQTMVSNILSIREWVAAMARAAPSPFEIMPAMAVKAVLTKFSAKSWQTGQPDQQYHKGMSDQLGPLKKSATIVRIRIARKVTTVSRLTSLCSRGNQLAR